MYEHRSIHVRFHQLCVHVHAQRSDLQADGCRFAAIWSTRANFLLESFAAETRRQSKRIQHQRGGKNIPSEAGRASPAKLQHTAWLQLALQ